MQREWNWVERIFSMLILFWSSKHVCLKSQRKYYNQIHENK